jgi:hypothetical protein
MVVYVTGYPAIYGVQPRYFRDTELLRRGLVFPDLDRSRLKVYPMLSLFRFDGKVPDDNPHILLLGVDGIAGFHGANFPVRVLLSHELFHLYHFQVNPVPKPVNELPLYRQVWQEGLATYVSEQLNPNAPLEDMLLDPRLAREGPTLIPTFARRILPQLETADDSIAAEYLSYRRNSELPSREPLLLSREERTLYPPIYGTG